MIRSQKYGLAILSLAGSLLIAPAMAQEPPKGVSQQQAMEKLGSLTKRLIVAEVAASTRRLPESRPLSDSDGSWRAVSQAFDLHVIRRPGAAALHRRFTDLVESPDLHREELRRIFTDLERLLRPFVPYPLGENYIRDQNDFANRLTTKQIEKMRAGGLAFNELSRDQQAQWLRINAAFTYSTQYMVIERTARSLNRWRALDLIWGQGDILEPYLSVTQPDRSGRINLTHSCRRTWDTALYPGSRSEAPQRTGLPSVWKKATDLESGEQALSAIIRRLEIATGLTIDIPDYARSNILLVVSGRAAALDVAAVLEDIYGWELRYDRGKRWILDRPAFRPARNAQELHDLMLRALPPSLRVMFRSTGYRQPVGLGSMSMLGSNHRTMIYRAMLAEINEKHGDKWKRLHLADLPESAQRKAANLIPLVDALSVMEGLCRQSAAKAHLVAPETGWFTAGGQPGDALKGSVLKFSVPTPGGGLSSWGWAVGSSSLER